MDQNSNLTVIHGEQLCKLLKKRQNLMFLRDFNTMSSLVKPCPLGDIDLCSNLIDAILWHLLLNHVLFETLTCVIGLDRQRFWVWNCKYFISFNVCFGCTKEPSHWDGSFEYPQHMFWLRNKNCLGYTLLTKGYVLTLYTVHCWHLLLNHADFTDLHFIFCTDLHFFFAKLETLTPDFDFTCFTPWHFLFYPAQ